MTREQALAVAWEALVVLAANGQMKVLNDKGRNRVWFGIANTRVEVKDGKARLVDLSANTSPSVGTK